MACDSRSVPGVRLRYVREGAGRGTGSGAEEEGAEEREGLEKRDLAKEVEALLRFARQGEFKGRVRVSKKTLVFSLPKKQEEPESGKRKDYDAANTPEPPRPPPSPVLLSCSVWAGRQLPSTHEHPQQHTQTEHLP